MPDTQRDADLADKEAAFHAALRAEFQRGTFVKVERPGLIPRDER
jgi:hypothetical protein